MGPKYGEFEIISSFKHQAACIKPHLRRFQLGGENHEKFVYIKLVYKVAWLGGEVGQFDCDKAQNQ